MTRLTLTCLEVEEMEGGYFIVRMLSSSNDPTIYATGNVSFTHPDGIGFEPGVQYDLNLLPVEPESP